MKVNLKNKKLYANLLIIAGMILIICPLIITHFNTTRNNDIIDDFLNQSQQALVEASSLSNEELEPFFIPDSITQNERSQADIADYSKQDPNDSMNESHDLAKKPLMTKEEIQKRMTGVLIIEKIDLRMVIMDGVDEETLRVAAGRIPGTGKIDEAGNCVLAGHRNYTFGKYFNRLNELEAGDEIIIQTPDKKLRYSVFEKRIVEPDDSSVVEQNDKEKILTLFTCHPVAIASHRLVVLAKQMD